MIKTNRVYELKAYNQKSYYGKAIVIETETENIYLKSYNTIVCGIVDGVFVRFWDGYSVTTQKHINDFRYMNGLSSMGKSEWTQLEISQILLTELAKVRSCLIA